MKHLLKLGVFLVSAILLAGCAKEEESKTMESYAYVEDKDSYVLENEYLKFSLDPATTYFQVTDKKNNTIWNSNPIDGVSDPSADEESKRQLQSTLLAKYSTEVGIQTTYSNYEYSIVKQIYEIVEENDSIKVKYTIGDVEKIFIYPAALPESRMQVFLDKMDSKQKKQIDSYYRKYDINKLRASDNKAELLELYPDLENENVYVIRDKIQDYISIKLEEVFKSAGYTMEDYEEDSNRYAKGTSGQKPFFNVSIVYRLENGELVVEVPFEEIEWPDKFPLTELTVLPYFCAGTTTDNGYILVPEGSGGIINFNNKKIDQSPYYAQVYGWDNGMKRDSLVDESRVTFPVYGVAKNGSSVLCILEDNSAVASISADVSGRKHSYNYVNTTYTLLHSASVQVSAKSDRSVMVYEAKKPEGVMKQRYHFFETDKYSTMAEIYREYLVEKYPELTKKEETGTPVNITVIGAIDAVKQRFGFPVSVPVPLTSFKEAKVMLTDLVDKGYRNLSICYSGMFNGGVKQKNLKKIKLVNELGSKKQLQDYLAYAKEQNVSVFMDGLAGYAYKGGVFDGLSINRDSSKYPSREVVKLYDFSAVWFGEKDWNDCYYMLKPQLTASGMKNLSKTASKYQAAGVAFRDIGNLISSDYNPKNLLTRQDVIAIQQETLAGVNQAGQKIMVKGGNDYILPYTDFITDMDLEGSHYQIIDYNIPFYPIALHGLVNYAGISLNLSGNYKDTILRSAEAGAGLSFTFMMEPVATLQNTNYTYYFGTDYDKWKDEAHEIYSRYEAELGTLFNQYITDHERLSDGVFVTSYEDGTRVFVNYNDIEYTGENITVPAHDYKVEKR